MKTVLVITILIVGLTNIHVQDQLSSKKYINYALSDSVVQSDLAATFEKENLDLLSVKYKKENYLYSVQRKAIKESSEKPEGALIVKITDISIKTSKKKEQIKVEMVINNVLKVRIEIIRSNGETYTRKVKSKTISGDKKRIMVYFNSN